MATTETAPETGSPTAGTHSATEAEGGHGGGGLPQLNPAHYPSQLLWLVISFGLLYLMLKRVILPMIEGTLARRHHQIQADLGAARQLQSQSEQAAAAYEAALAEARAKASGIAGDIRTRLMAEVGAERDKVDAEVASKIAEAERAIDGTKRKALGELEQITGELVGEIVKRFIGKPPEPAQVAAAISAETAERRPLMDATFWALIALLLFFAIIIRAKLPRSVTGHLDRRAERIGKELDEAKRLREEAAALLAEYEAKRAQASKEAEEIVRRGKAEAEAYAVETRQRLAETVERRTRMAQDKIAQAESEAIKEVRAAASDLAVAAAQRIIATEVKGDKAAKLIEESIASLKSRLN